MSSNVLDQLTPAQREVALLVAEGHSTPDIARRLGKPEMTVKNHLTHTYQRLGIAQCTGHSPRVCLARMVWESQVDQLVIELLAERSAAA